MARCPALPLNTPSTTMAASSWRILDGPGKGASAQEKQYAAVQVSENVHAVSYLGKSGHTLTVVLNFATGRMFWICIEQC